MLSMVLGFSAIIGYATLIAVSSLIMIANYIVLRKDVDNMSSLFGELLKGKESKDINIMLRELKLAVSKICDKIKALRKSISEVKQC